MRRTNVPLLIITLILLVAGVLEVFSASVVISERNFGTPYYYFFRQAAAASIGLAALFLLQRIQYRIWKRLSLPLFIGSLALTAAVFIPGIGFAHGGATRWIDLGPLGTFQPSEFLKFSLILYLAGWLDTQKSKPKHFWSAFLPFLAIVGATGAVLIKQPDIGTLIVIGGGAIILYFLGGGKISQLVSLGLLAAATLGILVAIAPYRLSRLLVFFNPGYEPQGAGYHLNQALLAIGSGGFWGRGFGQSIQKYNYLPEPIGDSIFAVTVEEFGFIGATLLTGLYLALFLRALAIARRAPDFFGKLLAAGFGANITFQAFVNMAAISGLLPLTGVPLPFFSYGGTALIVNLAMVGIMLNVSKYAR